jgi:hypothetical protein
VRLKPLGHLSTRLRNLLTLAEIVPRRMACPARFFSRRRRKRKRSPETRFCLSPPLK